jgi:aspartyl-tRNA(Asn)/glutamyl-tRNA(Gln) amidotransferase subunit A
MSAVEMAGLTRSGGVSPSEVAEHAIERVERLNPEINAIIDFDHLQVRRDAAALTRRYSDGEELGPLHGVPFTIKDLTEVKDRPLTFGLPVFKNNIARVDAAIVKRLRAAGGLFLGKTNTPEHGYYGSTDNHLFGPTHNPWKHGYSAGGSSGGAGAAVAAGFCPLAEGSDGAGSVRIPASLCGIVGLKPSSGRVPIKIGNVFADWSFHGPMTRTVADSALMLDVIAGPDDLDPRSLPALGVSFAEEAEKDIDGWRVAWSPDLGFGEVDPEVARICADAVSAFEELGAVVTEASPWSQSPEEAMWHGIWVPGMAGSADELDWESLRGEVDDNWIDLLAQARTLTALDIARANTFRSEMWEQYAAFMRNFEILVSPTLCDASFPLGQFAPGRLAGKSLREQLLGWLLTYPFNMMTVPAITVPAGFTSDGRPVGLQIAGRLLDDAGVLRAAANFEAARPWASATPNLDVQ